MQIPKLPAEELAQLRASLAYRFPRTAKIPVVGDRGERLSLPILLGNPTGSARTKNGAPISPVWRTIVDGYRSATLDAAEIGEALVADCLLWPDPRTFAAWRETWPGLPGDIALAVLRMVGGVVAVVVEPSPVEEPPPEIEAALEAHPRAVWRRLVPAGATFDVAIDAPDTARYDAYSDAVAKRGEDTVAITREFAEAQLVACVGGPPAQMFDRFPGLAIFVSATARNLGRAAGEVELGE